MTFSWFYNERPDQLCTGNVSTITITNPTEDDVITCRVDNKFEKDTHVKLAHRFLLFKSTK